MKIAWQQLHHLAVVSVTGSKIGVVEGVSVDTESHAIVHYHIKPGRAVLGLFSKELLVSPASVVRITEQEMVVDDAVLATETETGNKKTRLAFSAPKGVEMSESD